MKNARSRLALSGLVMAAAVLPPIASASTGGTFLDPSFGNQGLLGVAFSSGASVANSTALTGSSAIVVGEVNADTSQAPPTLFALAKVSATGALDSTFGTGGTVSSALAGVDPAKQGNEAFDVAIDSVGRIVVAGEAQTEPTGNRTNRDLAVARFTPDGSPDASFGPTGDGIITLNPAGARRNDSGRALAIQPDGKIVVGGFSSNGADMDFLLVRLLADGSTTDSTFGNGGIVTAAVANGDDRAYALLLQPDGKIVLVGTGTIAGQTDAVLVRFDSAGQLDATFSGGVVAHSFATGAVDRAWAAALQPDGRILVGGDSSVPGGSTDVALARFNSDGTPDTSFGINGNVTALIGAGGDGSESINHLQLTPTGDIYASGYAREFSTDPDTEFAVMRFTPGGALDTTFGAGGSMLQSVGEGNDAGLGSVLRPDGRLLVVGRGSNTATGASDFGLLQVLPSPPVAPTSAAQVTAGTPALSMSVLPNRSRIVSGQRVRIGLRARNTGTATATSVVACTTLAARLVVMSAPGATRTGRKICFAMGDIPSAGQVTRVVTARGVSMRSVRVRVMGTAVASGGQQASATAPALVITPRRRAVPVTG